jgi:hypothetical protein
LRGLALLAAAGALAWIGLVHAPGELLLKKKAQVAPSTRSGE